jgi:hypothetical protein
MAARGMAGVSQERPRKEWESKSTSPGERQGRMMQFKYVYGCPGLVLSLGERLCWVSGILGFPSERHQIRGSAI